jgi:hypothetical protein
MNKFATFFVQFLFLVGDSNGFQLGSRIGKQLPAKIDSKASQTFRIKIEAASSARSSSLLKMLIATEETAAMGILGNPDNWVFLIGVFPFAWATVEFWRRIAFGEAFGTGSDQIIIGVDDSPVDSRGRRVLGKGALGIAYFLFAASFATLAVVLYSVISSTPPPPEVLPSQQIAQDALNIVIAN